MITFTLRLQENEADALDRLAFVYGVSKNRLVNALIANEYDNFINGEPVTLMDEELITMSMSKDFPDEYIEGRGKSANYTDYYIEEIRKIIKCYDYAIENTDKAEEVDALEAARHEWAEELKKRGSRRSTRHPS